MSNRTLAVFAVVAAAVCSSETASSAPPGFAPLEIGAAAPDFSLPGVDGKQYVLKDFAAAKLLCIVFTCNHCPTAQAYEARLKQLHADYKDRGVALVAISPNDDKALRLDELGYTDVGDSFEDMKLRAAEQKFEFPYLYDGETQKVSAAYGVVATPQVFLFDAEAQAALCRTNR
ncbi:MAG: redoxin domain-containing protein [Pirellulales bacterium]